MKPTSTLGLAACATSLLVTGITVTALGSGCTTTTVIASPPATTPDAAPEEQEADAGPSGQVTTVAGKSGDLFGDAAKTFAKVDAEGNVVSVGATFEMTSFTSAPADHRFQDDLVLEMPKAAQEQTIVSHLRVNWLANGHGPDPYGDPHFDFHFYRGSIATIDAIECRADETLPAADKVPNGYDEPSLCTDRMGFHAWPSKDTSGGEFRGSIILGYWSGDLVFIEPMIPLTTLEKRATFELPIPKPQSAGGATTLYPTHMLASWDADTKEYTFELDRFESID